MRVGGFKRERKNLNKVRLSELFIQGMKSYCVRSTFQGNLMNHGDGGPLFCLARFGLSQKRLWYLKRDKRKAE